MDFLGLQKQISHLIHARTTRSAAVTIRTSAELHAIGGRFMSSDACYKGASAQRDLLNDSVSRVPSEDATLFAP